MSGLFGFIDDFLKGPMNTSESQDDGYPGEVSDSMGAAIVNTRNEIKAEQEKLRTASLDGIVAENTGAIDKRL